VIQPFWRSVSSVLTGMVIAQSIPILSSLLIARIYAPHAFGIFAAWLGTVMFFAVMVTWRFEVTLVLDEAGKQREFSAFATVVTIFISCTMLSLFVLGAYLWRPYFLDFPLLLFVLFVPAIFFLALSITWQSWAAADGLFTFLSAIRIVQAFSIAIFQVTLGYLSPDMGSLVVGQVLGCLVAVLFATCRKPLSCNHGDVFRRLRDFWSRHRRFPMLSLPADSINSAAVQLPLLIINSHFGADIGGVFALTMRVMGAPIGLLGAAVRDVFKRSAADSYRTKGNCINEYIRTFRVLSMCAVFFTICVVFVSEPIFVLAFGETWRSAGVMAVWLIPMFALRFVASPLSYTMYIAEKQHVDLIWQICLLVVTIASLLSQQTYKDALILYSLSYSALYVIYLFLSYRFSHGLTVDSCNELL